MSHRNHAAIAHQHANALLRAYDSVEMDRTNIRDVLQEARLLVEAARRMELITVERARTLGLSWTDIGHEYDITRQAAQQRFKS